MQLVTLTVLAQHEHYKTSQRRPMNASVSQQPYRTQHRPTMSGHPRPAPHFVRWLRSHAVALLVVATIVADAHLMEILMEAEEPPAAFAAPASFFDLKAALQSAATGLQEAAAAAVPEAQVAAAGAAMGQCRIEYQVMKSVAGRCTRLGRSGTHACVSDGHLVPFHPECAI